MTTHTEYQSITIETIDEAILNWFDVTVDANVEFPNGQRKKVPVQFSAGERAVASRQKRGIRDRNGVLVLPLINIQRSGIEPDPKMQALGTETPTLQISRQVSGETNNLRNLEKAKDPSTRLASDPVVYEVTSIPFPDRSIFNYKLIIQTQYMVQMNTILEKIFHELDIQKSFVATFNPRKHALIGVPFEERPAIKDSYVVGFFSDTLNDTGNLDEFTDQERIVRYQTNFTVPATLQLDPEGEKPAIQKEYTAYKVDFSEEKVIFVKNISELDKFFSLK